MNIRKNIYSKTLDSRCSKYVICGENILMDQHVVDSTYLLMRYEAWYEGIQKTFKIKQQENTEKCSNGNIVSHPFPRWLYSNRFFSERVAVGGWIWCKNLLKTLVFTVFSSNKGSKTVILDQKSFYHDATRLKRHWHLQWLMHSSSCFLSTIAFFNVWKCIDTHILYILYQMHMKKGSCDFTAIEDSMSLRRWYKWCNLMLLTMW